MARTVQLEIISNVAQVGATQHTEIIMEGLRYVVLEKAAAEDTDRFLFLLN